MGKINELLKWLRGKGFVQEGQYLSYRDKLVKYYVSIDNDYVRIGAFIVFNGIEYEGDCIYSRKQLDETFVAEDAMLLAMKEAFIIAMRRLMNHYVENSILGGKI